MSAGSPGPSAKEFCALKKPGAQAKVLTPCPKPVEPEGADGASFGGIPKFADKSKTNAGEAPGQFPIPPPGLAVSVTLVSSVREGGWVRKQAEAERHSQGGQQEGPRLASPPGQEPRESSGSSLSPTSFGPGQGSSTPDLTLPQPTQTTEPPETLAPPTQWHPSRGTEHLQEVRVATSACATTAWAGMGLGGGKEAAATQGWAGRSSLIQIPFLHVDVPHPDQSPPNYPHSCLHAGT